MRAKGEPRESFNIYLSTIPRSLLQQTILSKLVQPADVSVTGEEVVSSIAVYHEHGQYCGGDSEGRFIICYIQVLHFGLVMAWVSAAYDPSQYYIKRWARYFPFH